MRAQPRDQWQWPLDLSGYDQRTELTGPERDWLTRFVERPARSAWQQAAESDVIRLLAPLRDALATLTTHEVSRRKVTRLLLSVMHQRQQTVWDWQEADWLVVFEQARQRPYRVMLGTVSVAYLLGCFQRCHRVAHLQGVALAQQVFGVRISFKLPKKIGLKIPR